MNKMKIDQNVLPGLRIIKTIVALTICMIISYLSGGFLHPYTMGIVSILAVQESVIKGFNEIKTRVSSTIIGGIIGIIFMSIGYITNEKMLNIVLVPLGIFLILYFCSKLIDKSQFIIIACYVFLAITLDEEPEVSWIYPLKIMVATFVSSSIGILVNMYNPSSKRKFKITGKK